MSVPDDRLDTPTVRARIAHKFTLKDGWTVSETTVELTTPLPTDGSAEAFQRILGWFQEKAYEEGAREAQRRNRVEGR